MEENNHFLSTVFFLNEKKTVISQSDIKNDEDINICVLNWNKENPA